MQVRRAGARCRCKAQVQTDMSLKGSKNVHRGTCLGLQGLITTAQYLALEASDPIKVPVPMVEGTSEYIYMTNL